jgi:hypothetical protein
MIKVKTFSTQLKIFHTRNELEELDRQVNEYISSHGVRKVISVSDASTAGGSGETIGLIRTLAYEAPASEARAHYQDKIDTKLQEWGDKIRKKAQKAGRAAGTAYRKTAGAEAAAGKTRRG